MAPQAVLRASALVALGAVVSAHPEKLICKDPRLVEGGMMMHNYVVSNQYTDALLFTASATSYQAGDEVTLDVVANGSKYVNFSAPKGVFLAIQSRSTCTLVGDHGSFVNTSSDLGATAGCASGVFSKTAGGAFTGSSSATWRAGPSTTGSVTFTLLWSNGPGASDPLSVAGKVRVPDSYLHMKTVTLSGPDGPCPPPSPVPPVPPAPRPPSKDKCVAPDYGAHCPVAGARAPVFVQALGEEDGEVTFPSGKCLRCRVDHRGTCKSAMVKCPEEPGHALEERIWASSSTCEGAPTRVAYLRPEFAYCPGPEHYSVEALDLERFVPKLLRDHGHHVESEAVARAAIEEYRKMLLLIQRFPDRQVVPSKLVDLVWHEHILDTMQYKRDCMRLFGRYVHHNPSFGGEEEKAELSSRQADMFVLYRTAFEDEPPVEVWPTAGPPRTSQRLGAGGPLPDCCSAKCVKPSCHDCVGCNSVQCGYLAGHENTGEGVVAARRLSAPDAFSGYVPATDPLLEPPAPAGYLCSLEWNGPRGAPYALSLDWTICGERIYFKQALYGLSAWYSLGLAGKAHGDMGLGDYMLSMFSKNYSGVKDLYKYDEGNGYPCFDVLYECSVGNTTKGSKDTDGDTIRRENGMTESTWSRRMNTTDPKDVPIRRGNMTVLLAHGTEDYFTYHGQHQAKCEVDFFDGLVDCGAAAVTAASPLRPPPNFV